MANLPSRLVAGPDPELKDIKVGEVVYLKRSAMHVNSGLECFLNPAAKVEHEKDWFRNLRVERRDDGFHVTIIYQSSWEPGESSLAGWIPVVSLAEAYEPNPYVEMVKESQDRLKKLREG